MAGRLHQAENEREVSAGSCGKNTRLEQGLIFSINFSDYLYKEKIAGQVCFLTHPSEPGVSLNQSYLFNRS